ncbi:MAG: hypothetical protein ACFCUT_03695 [Kiloniellaceae bacterium]
MSEETPSVADRIFGGSATEPAKPAGAPAPQDSVASRIYGSAAKSEPTAPARPNTAAPAKPSAVQPERSAAERVFGQQSQQPKADAAKPEGQQQTVAEPFDLKQHAAELKIDAEDPISGQFAEVAAELKLDKSGAAKLMEFDAKRTSAAWDGMSAAWLAESKASPTYASDVRAAQGVLRAYGDAELVTVLETFRLGNHPSVLKLLGRIGRRLGHR